MMWRTGDPSEDHTGLLQTETRRDYGKLTE